MNRHQVKPRGLGRRPTKRSRTGVLGVGFTEFSRNGKRVSYYTANVGTVRKFRTGLLGHSEAFRRAVKARADFERRAS